MIVNIPAHAYCQACEKNHPEGQESCEKDHGGEQESRQQDCINTVNYTALVVALCRKRYPKCSFAKPHDKHPKGFRSVSKAMNWSRIFLQRLVKEFGEDLVRTKLSNWRWTTTTCFSGIGCAETVGKGCSNKI